MFCVLSISAFAQTEKGRFNISGATSLDFSYAKTNLKGNIPSGFERSGSTTNLNIISSVGYFVMDNLSADLEFIFSMQRDVTDNRISQFSLIPGAMYYYLRSGLFRPFIKAGIGYTNSSVQIPLESGGTKTQFLNGYVLAGATGVSFFLRENISIDLSAQ